jgi:hypothetical protein
MTASAKPSGGFYPRDLLWQYAQCRTDFQMISLEDINLQHEVRVNHSTGVVSRHEWTCVRRVLARVEGRSTTVAMYQGNSTEKVCDLFSPYGL